MNMNSKYTRFRVFNMGENAISMLYAADSSIKLIEARYNDNNKKKIQMEMEMAGCRSVDSLHISSWNESRCIASELKNLLIDTNPTVIEIPAAEPKDENGVECKKIINSFCNKSLFTEKFEAGPRTLVYPSKLDDFEYTDVILFPLKKEECRTGCVVKLFWLGRFSVLNAGLCSNNHFVQSLSDVLQGKKLDVLVVDKKREHINFLNQEFVDKFQPAYIVELGNEHSLYVRKDSSYEIRGLNSDILKDGDIIITSGSYKKESNASIDPSSSILDNEYTGIKQDNIVCS